VGSGRAVLPRGVVDQPSRSPVSCSMGSVVSGGCGGLSFCSTSPTCGIAALSSPAPSGTELLFSEVEGASCCAPSFAVALVTWVYDAFHLGQALYMWPASPHRLQHLLALQSLVGCPFCRQFLQKLVLQLVASCPVSPQMRHTRGCPV